MSIEFKQTTMPNGLTIIAEVDPNAHSAAIGFYVKTGARDEDPAVMGVSHFLEHMMFKGSETKRAADVDQAFDNIGAEHNAFTTTEMTAFWAHCLPEHLGTAEEVLADILRPALRTEDFDQEKKVILEEIAMYEDYPFWVLYEQAMETYYGTHSLSHRVLGKNETISPLTRDQMLEYFQARYSSDNTIVAMAGNLDFDEQVQRISDRCGSWTQAKPRGRVLPKLQPEKEFTIDSANAHRHYVLMIAPGPAITDERRYAASVLSHILGDIDGSRLYWALIEPGHADEAQSQYDSRDGVGELLVYASCTPGNSELVKTIILKEINSLAASLTQDDLDRVKQKIATAITLHSELPAGRMQRLGRMWCYLGQYRSLETELEKINAVTIDDVKDFLREFPWLPIVTGHLTPKQNGEASDQETPTAASAAHGK